MVTSDAASKKDILSKHICSNSWLSPQRSTNERKAELCATAGPLQMGLASTAHRRLQFLCRSGCMISARLEAIMQQRR